MSINFIDGSQITKALSETYRVYLSGNLSIPQPELEWLHDDHIEIGISNYIEFTADKPHLHKTATEYNFVLKGESKVYIIDENKEYTFKQGSLFVVSPNTRYASKHQADTQVLFFKVPGVNDKQLVEMTPFLKTWLEAWNEFEVM